LTAKPRPIPQLWRLLLCSQRSSRCTLAAPFRSAAANLCPSKKATLLRSGMLFCPRSPLCPLVPLVLLVPLVIPLPPYLPTSPPPPLFTSSDYGPPSTIYRPPSTLAHGLI